MMIGFLKHLLQTVVKKIKNQKIFTKFFQGKAKHTYSIITYSVDPWSRRRWHHRRTNHPWVRKNK